MRRYVFGLGGARRHGCTFSRARQLYYAADSLVWLPAEAEAAEGYAVQAVDVYRDASRPEWAYGDQAGSHADLAVARISRGNLDGAVDAIAPVFDLAPGQRINGVVRAVQRFRDALSRSPLGIDPAARSLQEQGEEFTRIVENLVTNEPGVSRD